jgi:hypothetical protein
MAISTYAELKQAVLDWANKPEIEQSVATFIQLAEVEFNRTVRHYKMVSRRTTTLAAGSYRISQPPDWLEAINIQATGQLGPYALFYSAPFDLDGIRQGERAGGEPRVYGLAGLEIEVAPTPTVSTTIEQIYYAKIPSLSDTVTTNWLLTDHPDLYLFGALTQYGAFETDPRVELWRTAYDRSVGVVNTASDTSAHSGGPLIRRRRTFG